MTARMTGRTPTMISNECEKMETVQASEYTSNIPKHKYLHLSNLPTQTRPICKGLDKQLQTRSPNKLIASENWIILGLLVSD